MSEDRAESKDLIETYPKKVKEMKALWGKQLKTLSKYVDPEQQMSPKSRKKER